MCRLEIWIDFELSPSLSPLSRVDGVGLDQTVCSPRGKRAKRARVRLLSTALDDDDDLTREFDVVGVDWRSYSRQEGRGKNYRVASAALPVVTLYRIYVKKDCFKNCTHVFRWKSSSSKKSIL